MDSQDISHELITTLAKSTPIIRDGEEVDQFWRWWNYHCPVCDWSAGSRESIRLHLYSHTRDELKEACLIQLLGK